MRVILKQNDKYVWEDNKQIIKDNKTLTYIKSLVIPPAYKDVNIYYEDKPKILYSGIDAAGRPQYIYSKWWSDQTREIKFCTLIKFGEKLPRINDDINHLIKHAKHWNKNEICALILRIISMCYFRVGNVKYTKLYSSYGITTVKSSHMKFSANGMNFKFIGKKGVLNTCHVVDKTIIKAIQYLVNVNSTGFIFQYNCEGEKYHIKHTDINNFLKRYNPEFTSKLFRTYDTNILLLKYFKDGGSEKKKKIVVNALKHVSSIVHNTPAICKKDYADPELINLFLFDDKFKKLFPGKNHDKEFIAWLKKTKKC